MRKKEMIVISISILIIFSIAVSAETISWRTLYKGMLNKKISYVEINGIYQPLNIITGKQSIDWDDHHSGPAIEPQTRRIDLTTPNPNYIFSCRSYVNDFITESLMKTLKQSMIDVQSEKLSENIKQMQQKINQLSQKYYEAQNANDETTAQEYLRQILEINNTATVLREHYEFFKTDDDFWTSYFCDERSDFWLLEGCANSMQKTRPDYPDANLYQICEDCIKQYRDKYCKRRVFDEEEITEIVEFIPFPKDITIGMGQRQIRPEDFEKLRADGKKEKKKFDEYLQKCKECEQLKEKSKKLEKDAEKIKIDVYNLQNDFKNKLTKIETLKKDLDEANKEKEEYFKEKSWASSGDIKVTDVDLRLTRQASKQAWEEYRKAPSREKAKWVESRWKYYSTPEGREELRKKASELFGQEISTIKEKINTEEGKKDKIQNEIQSKQKKYKDSLKEADQAKKEYEACYKKYCEKKQGCPEGQYTNPNCEQQCPKELCERTSIEPECYECKKPVIEPTVKDIIPTTTPKKDITPLPEKPKDITPKAPPKTAPKLDCSQEFPGMELMPATCIESCKAHGDFNSIPNKKICHNYKIEMKFKQKGDQTCCARKITETPIPGCTEANWGGWTQGGKPIVKEETTIPTQILPELQQEEIRTGN
ncbi:hypothetical protein JW851_02440 [Candidatus Woesearchaeota archaeon]|nr:hypothetical protein [Candidatus Woesearchaeota archaeon]